MGGKVGENPAALRAAVFSLSSKNLRGGVQTPPPSRARVNWRSNRSENFTQYAHAGDLSNGIGRDPVKYLLRLVIAKYFLG